MNHPATPASEYQEHLKVFGDAWMLIVASVLFDGPCRFNEIQRRACGISPVTLTARLKKLEQLGLAHRSAGQEDQLSVSYALTDRGNAMKPVLDAIRVYGHKHFGPDIACHPQND